MINKEKTLEIFGINSDLLSDGSHKKIVITCDYCGNDTQNAYKNYIFSKKNTVIDKDCCMKCRPLKAKECNRARDRSKEIAAGNLQRQKTCLEKYGVEHITQTSEFKNQILKTFNEKTEEEKKSIIEKRRETILETYGETLPDRIKEKLIAKYGVPYCPQTEEMQEKREQTCLEKYGTRFPAQLEEIKEKIKTTSLEKFGFEHHSQTPEFRAKISELSSNRSDEIKQKIINTNIEKFGFPNPLQNEEIKKKMIATKIKKGSINNFGGKTDNEWAQETGFSRTYVNYILNHYGLDALKKLERGSTDIERVIKGILLKNNIEFVFSPVIYSQTTKHHKRGDFLIGNLVLEADGNFWHSEGNKKQKYHKEKRDFYLENGHDCLFFRADEIIFKSKIVESIILNKLGKNSTRIFARKCEIKIIDFQIAKKFFTDNHLMGNGSGKSFGLFLNNQLVSGMQFRKKDGGYEISRYCNVLNTSVVGGFSKLLSFAINYLQTNKIITFIDLRYGNGSYLPNFGFTKETEYLSFRWTDRIVTFHRMTFPGNSGYEHKLTKLWDCGQAKWVKYIN